MAPVEIRRAMPDEYEEVGKLTAYAYEADGFAPQGYVSELQDAAARAAAGDLLVAVDGDTGELLGTASLFTAEAGPRWAEGARDGDAVLRMLGVSPSARRRGIARALTLACVRLARERGCRRLILSTRPQMTAAHRLYEQLGFCRDPAAGWEPVPGVELWVYWLAL